MCQGTYDLDRYLLVYGSFDSHTLFHLNLLLDQGTDISLRDKHDLRSGDRVLVYQEDMKENYALEKISEHGSVSAYRIRN